MALSSANDSTSSAKMAGKANGRGARSPSDQGGFVIHFSPNITIHGNTGAEVKGALENATQLSMSELERMMKRLLAQQQRREN